MSKSSRILPRGLLAGSLGSTAKLITAFVAGHSLTLLVATLAGWKLNAGAGDVVIALSLLYVGAQGLRGRPADLRVFATIVFAFGLVHGWGSPPVFRLSACRRAAWSSGYSCSTLFAAP